MRVEPPIFRSKRPCPVCKQGSSLVFLTCRNCSRLILACDEEGSVFPDPSDLSVHAHWPHDAGNTTEAKCPHCEQVSEFSLSTGEEIQAAGISLGEYE